VSFQNLKEKQRKRRAQTTSCWRYQNCLRLLPHIRGYETCP
jgi:hypothetical protein